MSADIPMDEGRTEMLEQIQFDARRYVAKEDENFKKCAEVLLQNKTLLDRLFMAKGLMAIEILKRIEDLCNKEIFELFDIICGASTGAILAFLLGIKKVPLEECEHTYKKLSLDIFEQNALIGTGKLFWSHAYYDTAKFEKILKKDGGDAKMIDSAKDTSIPKVLSIRTSDGGLLTNNPSSIAIHEARRLWPDEPFQCIVSVGTGKYKGRSRPSTLEFSSLREKLLKVVASATDTEAVDTVLSDVLPPLSYFRFNPNMSADIPMDEGRTEMLEQIQFDARRYVAKEDENFKKCAEVLLQNKTLLDRLFMARFKAWYRVS
ncbi:PREDICTED: calcium-independent phospholipase A2-gamma-like [Acropora digitifera]|uniref:calcium-independent phospholipase A2-gamma-like n=1 Tax=Acropora digitifera TaxID=70779 RepID=UPI00077A0E57|nr:PREDICTED: calcium-independent phospholipase A2-gamma-like [Acropora digitifera]